MIKYFSGETKGLKADVERHRVKEKELQNRIQELEQQDQNDPMIRACIRAYRRNLNILQQSKAEILIKLGKRK